MSVKHKLWHWYGTLLSDIQSFSNNSPLVNQNLVYSLNQNIQWIWQMNNGRYFGGKRFNFWSTVKCLLLAVIWPFFLCGFNFSCSRWHCIQILQICVWSARNNKTSDNWVLPIIWCPPVLNFFFIFRNQSTSLPHFPPLPRSQADCRYSHQGAPSVHDGQYSSKNGRRMGWTRSYRMWTLIGDSSSYRSSSQRSWKSGLPSHRVLEPSYLRTNRRNAKCQV